MKHAMETKCDKLFDEFSNKFSNIINAKKTAVETLKTEVNHLKKLLLWKKNMENSEAFEHLNEIIIAGNGVPDATTNEN